jgi:O-methyltransferase domain
MTDEGDIEGRLRRSVEAYHEAALLYAAVKLGLAEKMGARSYSAGALAEALGLSAPHLARFLRGLCIMGICEQHPGEDFTLTPFGQSLTQDSRLGQKVRIVVEQYWLPWANLIATLPAGTPAFDQIFGMGVADWRRAHPEQGAMFASYLVKGTQAETDAVLAALDVSETDRVIEIGADAARLTEIPPKADLYLLKGVLQNHDDAGAAAILRTCRTAMPDGARLVIVERLLPERAAAAPAAIMLDLHMMTITGGRVRSLAEFEALLSEACLALLQTTATRVGLTVIEARTA